MDSYIQTVLDGGSRGTEEPLSDRVNYQCTAKLKVIYLSMFFGIFLFSVTRAHISYVNEKLVAWTKAQHVLRSGMQTI